MCVLLSAGPQSIFRQWFFPHKKGMVYHTPIDAGLQIGFFFLKKSVTSKFACAIINKLPEGSEGMRGSAQVSR